MTSKSLKKNINIDELYDSRILTNTISINPRLLNTLDMNELILKNLIEKINGKCISDGIINTDSIEILNRSLGALYNHDTSGSIHYVVKYKADVCNPREGQVIQCVVAEHTDTQTICYIGSEETSPLEIYLSKQNHINNKDYASLKSGDNIIVRIVGRILEAGRDKIDTIAEFIKKA